MIHKLPSLLLFSVLCSLGFFSRDFLRVLVLRVYEDELGRITSNAVAVTIVPVASVLHGHRGNCAHEWKYFCTGHDVEFFENQTLAMSKNKIESLFFLGLN
jgi:hypothetical protein